MVGRITISLDPRLESKLRALQARKMVESHNAISLSKVISELLMKVLKGFPEYELRLPENS